MEDHDRRRRERARRRARIAFELGRAKHAARATAPLAAAVALLVFLEDVSPMRSIACLIVVALSAGAVVVGTELERAARRAQPALVAAFAVFAIVRATGVCLALHCGGGCVLFASVCCGMMIALHESGDGATLAGRSFTTAAAASTLALVALVAGAPTAAVVVGATIVGSAVAAAKLLGRARE